MIFNRHNKPFDLNTSHLKDSNKNFANHQNWQITTIFDPRPTFQVQDNFGIVHDNPTFVIYPIEAAFAEAYQKLSDVEKDKLVREYLRDLLVKATPYDVHIEKIEDKVVVRFGDTGLQGGGKDDYYALAGLQLVVAGGLVLSGVGAGLGGALAISTLVGTGVSGGAYAYTTEEEDLNEGDFLKQTVYGGIGGFVGGGVGHYAKGAQLVAKVGYQVLGGAAASTTTTAVEGIVEKGELPDGDNLLRQAFIGGVGGGVGGLVSSGTGKLIGSAAEVTDDLAGVFEKAMKGGIEGAASSGSSTITGNFTHNLLEEDEEKKRKWNENLGQSVFIGAGVGAALAAAQKVYEIDRKEEIREALKTANENKEEVLKKIEKISTKIGKTNTEIGKISGELKQLQDVLSGLNKEIGLLESQIPDLKTDVENKNSDLTDAEENYQNAQANSENLLNRIRNSVNNHLGNGFKAKIEGHYVNSPEDIVQAHIEGKKIEWKKGRNRFTGKRETFQIKATVLEEYQRTQNQLNTAQNELNQARGNFEGAESNLDQANSQLDQHNQKKGNLERDLLSKQTELLHKAKDLADNQGQVEKVNKLIKELNADKPDGYRPENPSLSPSRAARDLLEALEPNPDIFAKEIDWNEIADHVVLVHAINHESNYCHGLNESVLKKLGMNAEDAFNRALVEPSFKQLLSIIGAVTPSGVIGHHLDFEKKEFNNELIDRPHIHWCWNMLVEPNDGGDWEEAKIALLEPLKNFKTPPFGIAPYDTLTIGKHQFSKDAILLVPKSIVEDVRKYFKDFQGDIVGYTGSKPLRNKIAKVLKKYYPSTWHMCDEKGKLIAREGRRSAAGYRKITCVKTHEGKIIRLLEGERRPRSKALEFPESSKRFIGLHLKGATYRLEDNNDHYFRDLKRFKGNHNNVKENPLFAGNIENYEGLKGLGSLSCLDVCHDLMEYDPKTGTHDLSQYLLNEALYADIVSIFLKDNPDAAFELSSLDLKIILQPLKPYLENLLENISHFLEDETKEELVLEFFNAYCNMLREGVQNLCQAKEQANDLLINFPGKGKKKKGEEPLVLSIALDDWKKIPLPEEEIKFDLGTAWPLNDQMKKYFNKVVRTLPNDLDELITLHHVLNIADVDNDRECYRYHVIRSAVRWVLQEKAFRSIMGDDSHSVFAGKLAKYHNTVKGHPLFEEDFMITVGDCLFDNIIIQLKIPEITSQQLREDLVAFIRENKEKFSLNLEYEKENHFLCGAGEKLYFHNWEEYLNYLKRPQVWATDLEIGAMAEMLNRPIVLFSPDKAPLIYCEEAEGNPLFLSHKHGNHFVACTPFKGFTILDVYGDIKASYTMNKLRNEKVTQEEIIDVLSHYETLQVCFAKSAGIVEGYTVGKHTEMVLEVALQYRDHLLPQVSHLVEWDEFLLFLALHDIGKGVSKEADVIAANPGLSAKELELLKTREILVETMENLKIPPKTIQICKAMLMYDSQGEYLKGNMEMEMIRDQIREMAEACETEPRQFYQIYQVYHLADAASYPNLKPLFKFEESALSHCEGNQMTIDYLIREL